MKTTYVVFIHPGYMFASELAEAVELSLPGTRVRPIKDARLASGDVTTTLMIRHSAKKSACAILTNLRDGLDPESSVRLVKSVKPSKST